MPAGLGSYMMTPPTAAPILNLPTQIRRSVTKGAPDETLPVSTLEATSSLLLTQHLYHSKLPHYDFVRHTLNSMAQTVALLFQLINKLKPLFFRFNGDPQSETGHKEFSIVLVNPEGTAGCPGRLSGPFVLDFHSSPESMKALLTLYFSCIKI